MHSELLASSVTYIAVYLTAHLSLIYLRHMRHSISECECLHPSQQRLIQLVRRRKLNPVVRVKRNNGKVLARREVLRRPNFLTT